MLSLEFKDNNTGHDDIVLTVGRETIICDSYHLALDQGYLPKQENSEKVRGVLKLLLEQWIAAIPVDEKLCIVYLPFSFLDQGTGWLKCGFSVNEVSVSYGWSSIEGYSFSPSNISKYLNLITDYNSDFQSITVSKSQFRAAINSSILKTVKG